MQLQGEALLLKKRKKSQGGKKIKSTARQELWICFDVIKAYAAQLGKQMSKQATLNKQP